MKTKRTKRTLAALLAAVLLIGMLAACQSGQQTTTTTTTTEPTTAVAEATEAPTTEAPTTEEAPTEPPAADVVLPRNETLYAAGLQWGPIVGWNPFSRDMNNALAITMSGGGTRVTMFDTLYMYNMLNGSMMPLLADGQYEWDPAMTQITVKVKPAAKWSDGSKITAEDVAYTYECCDKYANYIGANYSQYIESVEAADESTVVVKGVIADGKAANPLMMVQFLGEAYIMQKAWLQTLEARCGYDSAAMQKDLAEDVVWSGPYTKYFWDDTKVVMIRDDNYWGQDASMWGKLPAPKYLAHVLYADNNVGQVALAAGEVDVCQQFISNVQDLWLKDGLPISTYMDEPPYGICVNMPTAYYNLSIPGLDRVEVRKAIAMAVDYDAINANAMTYQSPTFEEVPRSIMSPLATEQAMYNRDAVAHLQWAGKDIAGANALLDEAGIVDTDGDGWRDIDGKKLAFNACAPNGWTDWMSSMEIVAAAGQAIGIDITTNFPEWSVYQTVFTAAEQNEYDIFMYSTNSSMPSMPWSRARQLLSSEYIGKESNWSGNYGHYSNPRADELIKLIPLETDNAKLVDMYTECVEIYLTDVPSFSLMYRPDQFHAVNESVWTGFTEAGDGNEIPPMHSTDGYGIADLYNIRLVN